MFISRVLCLTFSCIFLLLVLAAVTLAADTPTGISLNKTSVTMRTGQGYGVTATVSPSDASQIVEWASSNSSVAVVQDGYISGESAGTATITAIAWGGACKASLTVTVEPVIIVATGIKLSKTHITMSAKTTALLADTLLPSDADTTVTWSSDNPSVAAPDIYGVYGESAGVAHIIATTSNGLTATCTVTVTVSKNSLKKLAVSGGKLAPAFEPATTTYTLTTSKQAKSVKITPTLVDSAATITINDASVTNGKAQQVNIENTSTIKIAVYDFGYDTRTYTLLIVWPNSTKSTSVSGSVYSAEFVMGMNNYFINAKMPGVQMDAAAYVDAQSGRVMVPVRYLTNALGAATQWDSVSQAVYVTKGSTTISMVIGSDTMSIDNKPCTMDAAPVIKDGRTYLPVRWIAQALNYQVQWDSQNQILVLWSGKTAEPDYSKIISLMATS
jgi:uncharacterized protein YjdB